jgi:hypothetical protein
LREAETGFEAFAQDLLARGKVAPED